MSGNPTGRAAWMLVLALAAPGGPAMADDRRGGEVGLVVGAFAPDEAMTGDSGSAEVSLGLRAGTTFSSHLTLFVDGLYSAAGTEGALGDAETLVGRAGADWLFNPERNARWLVSFGLGWMSVDYENAATDDFHNPLAAVGFGQRIRMAEKLRLRWELRADHTLDDARIGEELFQGHALLGLTWGPGGEPNGGATTTPHADADRDGVRDAGDRCPDTPAGAVVDGRGCPTDDDRDGVPNGVDRCPASRSTEALGPDGCPADEDGDGVADISDVCPATLVGAHVDEWGCPKDGDLDFVFDGLDGCPDTPRGARVDARGCPADGDGDGVLDGLDRCPDTPAGTAVDARGCVAP